MPLARMSSVHVRVSSLRNRANSPGSSRKTRAGGPSSSARAASRWSRERLRAKLTQSTKGGPIMRHRAPKLIGFELAALAFAVALAAAAFAAEYQMTVNRDRLVNAQNEPQNWLLMNGDYGSIRYSKLSQINRDTVKNLRLVWAPALRGMQGIGPKGPGREANPPPDNRFTYTTGRWGPA